MNEDFFDSGHREDDGFNGYSEIEGGTHHAVEPPTQQPISAAFSGQINYEQPLDLQTQQQEEDTLQKIRQQQDELRQRLLRKAEEEQQLKKKRREKAAKELEQWQDNRTKQMESSRTLHRQNSNKQKDKGQNYKGSWDKVADNVALKEGDYPGAKFVSRMRDCIIGKRDDELNKK